MRMDKILTIAVPAYNAAWCLDKCLMSFIDEQVLARLEIIIVNDGSTDTTGQIADGFAERFPKSFRVIHKQNGGHGSGINSAIDVALGKYFKVVDADDWVLTENLRTFVEVLSETNADVVLTHYHTIDMRTQKRRPFVSRGLDFDQVYTLEEFVSAGKDALSCATFHGITYKTAAYRQSGTRLTENIYYEDQEYATLPFLSVKTVLPLDLFLYEYLIGNAEQSVSDQNQVKRVGHIEKIIWSLEKCYQDHPSMTAGARTYFKSKLTDVILSYYVVSLVKNNDKKAGREAARYLRNELSKQDESLVNETNRKYHIALIMNYLHMSNKSLERLKRSALYTVLYRAIRRR